jgi:APA family basic amino acid/polyamine antiporter
VTTLNLLGIRRSVGASRVIVSVVGCALLGVTVAALLPRRGTVPWDAGQVLGPTAGEGPLGLLQAAGLLFFAFAGYARIATLGEEVKDPARVIPRAVVTALAAVLVLYLLVGGTVLGVLGADGTAASAAPVADVAALVWGERWAGVVRALAGVAAAGALLNLILGISRTAMAMARDGHLPAVLTRVSGAGALPRTAEAAVGLLVLLVVLLADLRAAIGFSSFGVLLYYAVANASAFTLRLEWVPGTVVPVLGLVGCLVLAAALPTLAVVGGSLLVLAGVLAYAVRARLSSR